MLKCRQCKAGFNEFTFRGWVVLAEGSASLGDNGDVESVGSLVTRCSVKPGQEVNGKHVQIRCPECGHEAHISNFDKVFRCFISGDVGDRPIKNPIVGNLYVCADMLDVASELLDPKYLDWECTEQTRGLVTKITEKLAKR